MAALEPNPTSETKESKTPADMGRAIKTVGDIVEQAKLLAANTTIEAARMGESGLGMSRLAAEMKKLAEDLAHQAGVMQTQLGETGSDDVDVTGGFGDVRKMVEDLRASQQKMAEMLSDHGNFIEGWEKDLLADEA